jgi:hypothetical protein
MKNHYVVTESKQSILVTPLALSFGLPHRRRKICTTDRGEFTHAPYLSRASSVLTWGWTDNLVSSVFHDPLEARFRVAIIPRQSRELSGGFHVGRTAAFVHRRFELSHPSTGGGFDQKSGGSFFEYGFRFGFQPVAVAQALGNGHLPFACAFDTVKIIWIILTRQISKTDGGFERIPMGVRVGREGP